MPKLHEILAVEPALLAVSEKLRKEAQRNLGKTELFSGYVKTHQLFDDEQVHLTQPVEVKEVETNALAVLTYALQQGFAPYVDAVLQKDATNQVAFADIEIDGVVIATAVPGTTLLGLEAKLNKLFDLFDALPTVASGISWTPAPEKGPGVYVNPVDLETFQTRKYTDVRTVVQATDKHPAQTRDFEVIDKVGKYVTRQYTGMITSNEKAELLYKLQKLTNAVKQARQRANHTEVVKVGVGEEIIAYLLG